MPDSQSDNLPHSLPDRPPDIRIHDLADPEFSEEQRQMIEGASAMAADISFTLDGLMAAAREQSGLEDFGQDEYAEPLAALCKSIEESGWLSPMGRLGSWSQLTMFLVNRLRLENLYKRNPEINDVEVKAPIIIAGMPRSGTTHLHNLIASDENLRSLPWWEALEPVAPEGEETIDGRVERAQQGIDQRNYFLPHFDRMHEMTWDHVHEEIHLLGMSGSTMLFDTMGVFPGWREHYKQSDQTPHYEYLKRILQALQYLRGGERWILKSPQHMEQFKPLTAVFPDATFAVTHRDPVSITASFCTMVGYSSRLSAKLPLDLHRLGHWWAQLIEDMLTACTRDRHLLPEDRSIDIVFHEFMADDVATVAKIYELAGQPFTEEVEQGMHSYMEEHPRGRHGRVAYDLSDFQIDPAERREALTEYVESFGINLES